MYLTRELERDKFWLSVFKIFNPKLESVYNSSKRDLIYYTFLSKLISKLINKIRISSHSKSDTIKDLNHTLYMLQTSNYVINRDFYDILKDLHIVYKSDKLVDYTKSPLLTLLDGCGDCEDLAELTQLVFASKIKNLMKLSLVFADRSGHVSLIYEQDDYVFEYDNGKLLTHKKVKNIHKTIETMYPDMMSYTLENVSK